MDWILAALVFRCAVTTQARAALLIPRSTYTFDQVGLAEITSPAFAGEGPVACRDPLLAATEQSALDGIYVVCTKLPAERMAGPVVVAVRNGVR